MVRDDLYITVPSYFRCPISLEVMRSPVSLCTGVTYDRSSIQRWLDGGNNTCPATMQLLQNQDLIPNHTLHRLINTWSDSLISTRPPAAATTDQAADEIIRRLVSQLQLQTHYVHKYPFITRDISRLNSFAAGSEGNGRFLAASGGRILPLLISHVERVKKDLSFLEIIIQFSNLLLQLGTKLEQDNVLKSRIITRGHDFKASIMMALKHGRLELRIAAAKFLDHLMVMRLLCLETHSISEEVEVYTEMLRLITSSDWNSEAMDASLSFLTRLTLVKKNRAKMVSAGGVKALAAALDGEEIMSARSTEKVLRLLEMASGCKEGRDDICGDEICVRAIVKKVLKVSSAATENAVTLLWSLCCVFGDKRASNAVARSNGMVKVLVVLQSNCSPAIRQMCGDLLRVLRCSSKSSCVSSWYDTKATNIMPF